MYIREIRIRQFRNLANVHLGPFAPPTPKSDIIVLAGANGSGKSSVLELISYALSNAFGAAWQLRRTFPTHSFEVAIGITADELALVNRYLAEKNPRYGDEPLEYLREHKYYFRTFNAAVTDSKRAQLDNVCHNIVSSSLRQHYRRALGFFLKSDRFYPPDGFQWQHRLFQHEEMSQLDYIWRMAYTTSDVKYKYMFDFLIQQRFHYLQRLGEYTDALEKGTLSPHEPRPQDPFAPYDALLRRIFPKYAFGEKRETIPSNLYIRLPSGEVVPFTDLSSGEKEVFFLLSFFIRHSVSNAVVAIDEPELHLHPELARKLVRTMLDVQPGNQVWLATHHGEIIDEAGRDKTFYMCRTEDDRSEVISGTDEPAAALQLRTLFGVSGFIGVARNMVFLEGEKSSADRKAFGWLFAEHKESVKLIPAGGVDNQVRINDAVLSILEATLGVCQFYLIRDRDYLTTQMVQTYSAHPSGRLYVLKRNQIENYLLDSTVMATVLSENFHVSKTREQIEQDCETICRALSGEVLRDMVTFRLNLIFRPQDFSLGRVLEKQQIIDKSGAWNTERLEGFSRQLKAAVATVDADLRSHISEQALQSLIDDCKAEIHEALMSGQWRKLFPGKRIIEELARRYELKNHIAFQNDIIKAMASNKDFIPDELSRLMQIVSTGRTFTDTSEPASVVSAG